MHVVKDFEAGMLVTLSSESFKDQPPLLLNWESLSHIPSDAKTTTWESKFSFQWLNIDSMSQDKWLKYHQLPNKAEMAKYSDTLLCNLP